MSVAIITGQYRFFDKQPCSIRRLSSDRLQPVLMNSHAPPHLALCRPAVFITITEQRQALDSQTRTILIFDYIAYVLTEKYVSLMGQAPAKK